VDPVRFDIKTAIWRKEASRAAFGRFLSGGIGLELPWTADKIRISARPGGHPMLGNFKVMALAMVALSFTSVHPVWALNMAFRGRAKNIHNQVLPGSKMTLTEPNGSTHVTFCDPSGRFLFFVTGLPGTWRIDGENGRLTGTFSEDYQFSTDRRGIIVILKNE
jgi:hypothetical protein